MSFMGRLRKSGRTPAETIVADTDGGRPFRSVTRQDAWTDFGTELCRQGLTGPTTEPRLYVLWKTTEMAEAVARNRPAAAQDMLAQDPEVMIFPDGSGAVAFLLKSERDFVKFVRVLLEGKGYGRQAVFQAVLAANVPEGDGDELATLFGAPQGVSIGNVFVLG
jgi:hypothetical protein